MPAGGPVSCGWSAQAQAPGAPADPCLVDQGVLPGGGALGVAAVVLLVAGVAAASLFVARMSRRPPDERHGAWRRALRPVAPWEAVEVAVGPWPAWAGRADVPGMIMLIDGGPVWVEVCGAVRVLADGDVLRVGAGGAVGSVRPRDDTGVWVSVLDAGVAARAPAPPAPRPRG